MAMPSQERWIFSQASVTFGLTLLLIVLLRVYLLPSQPQSATGQDTDSLLILSDAADEQPAPFRWLNLPVEPNSVRSNRLTGHVPGKLIKELPCQIQIPGYYYIDRTHLAGFGGILIMADDVTLDLMGFSLVGDPKLVAEGIRIAGRQNVEIRNGSVKAFGSHGIYGTDENGGGRAYRLVNLRLMANGQSGARLLGQGHLVSRCTAHGNGEEGVHVERDTILEQVVATENRKHGIYVGAGCNVSFSTASRNKDVGIFLGPAAVGAHNAIVGNQHTGLFAMTGATVLGNSISGNAHSGILAGSGCTIRQNTVWNNADMGIDSSDGVTVESNTVYDNKRNGLVVGQGASVKDNTIRDNLGRGILGGDQVTLAGNLVRGNTLSGMEVGRGCLLQGNIISNNNPEASKDHAGLKHGRRCQVLANTLLENGHCNLWIREDGSLIERNLLAGSDYGLFFDQPTNYYFQNRAYGNRLFDYGGKLPQGADVAKGNAQF